MGLFGSPAILQAVIEATMAPIKKYSWAHLDDILIWGNSTEEVRQRTAKAIRLLHEVGFLINLKKSVLVFIWCQPAGHLDF